jgi:hypothetical protein
MSGICQCLVCGELYYGDERDNWQTCSCSPPTSEEDVAKLWEEHIRVMDSDMETFESHAKQE